MRGIFSILSQHPAAGCCCGTWHKHRGCEKLSVVLSAGTREEGDAVIGASTLTSSPRCSGRLKNAIILLHRLQYGTAHGKGGRVTSPLPTQELDALEEH